MFQPQGFMRVYLIISLYQTLLFPFHTTEFLPRLQHSSLPAHRPVMANEESLRPLQVVKQVVCIGQCPLMATSSISALWTTFKSAIVIYLFVSSSWTLFMMSISRDQHSIPTPQPNTHQCFISIQLSLSSFAMSLLHFTVSFSLLHFLLHLLSLSFSLYFLLFKILSPFRFLLFYYDLADIFLFSFMVASLAFSHFYYLTFSLSQALFFYHFPRFSLSPRSCFISSFSLRVSHTLFFFLFSHFSLFLSLFPFAFLSLTSYFIIFNSFSIIV